LLTGGPKDTVEDNKWAAGKTGCGYGGLRGPGVGNNGGRARQELLPDKEGTTCCGICCEDSKKLRKGLNGLGWGTSKQGKKRNMVNAGGVQILFKGGTSALRNPYVGVGTVGGGCKVVKRGG